MEVDGMVNSIEDNSWSTQANIIVDIVRNLAKKEKTTSREIEEFKEKNK